MFDTTADRSAGAPQSPDLDPTRPTPPVEAPVNPLEDVTAGRSAGSAWNTDQDPTRPVSLDDPRA
jgi:hypothetical protein